jgi:hypothetical protein
MLVGFFCINLPWALIVGRLKSTVGVDFSVGACIYFTGAFLLFRGHLAFAVGV